MIDEAARANAGRHIADAEERRRRIHRMLDERAVAGEDDTDLREMLVEAEQIHAMWFQKLNALERGQV